MVSEFESVALFPDVIDVDMEHLLKSGCLDLSFVHPHLREARATLALTNEPLFLPSDHDHVLPENQPTPADDTLSPMEMDMSPPTPGDPPSVPSSPDIPLRVILRQRRSQQQEPQPSSSEAVPLAARPKVRVPPSQLQQAQSAEVPVFDVQRKPETYFAGLIPQLHKTPRPSHPAPPIIPPAVVPQYSEPPEPSPDALDKARRIWREWRRTNRRKAEEALKNPVVIPGIRLASFADDEQREWTLERVPELGPRVPCSGSQPHVLLGEDGVPLGWVFPEFLGNAAHDILFRELQQFAENVELTPDKRPGADSNTRNKRKAYQRSGRPGERSGCFQLVNIWGAIGHPDGQLGPSTDVVCGTVREFNAAAKLMEELGVVSKRIDHLIECIDPAQHTQMHKARRELCEEFPAYNLLSQLDPSYFHGRSLIYNRATPRHKDIRDKKFAWTPVLTLGNYTSGTFKVLNQDVEYLPRTLILLRGAVFPHEVTYTGGARVCIAHFTHEYVLNRTSVGALPLMTASDVAAHLKAIRQQHAAAQRPKDTNPKKARRRKEKQAQEATEAAD